jgi:hypothetical protein
MNPLAPPACALLDLWLFDLDDQLRLQKNRGGVRCYFCACIAIILIAAADADACAGLNQHAVATGRSDA